MASIWTMMRVMLGLDMSSPRTLFGVGATGLLALAIVSTGMNCGGNGRTSQRDELSMPNVSIEDVRLVLGGLDIGTVRNSYSQSIGGTDFTLFIGRAPQLWVLLRYQEPRRAEWPPGSGQWSDVSIDELKLPLGFVGTAMLRRSDSEVLIAGRTRADRPVLSRVTVSFEDGQPSLNLEVLPLHGDFGLVSQLGLVSAEATPGTPRAEWILALDARHGALHAVALDTGELHTLADVSSVPPLKGRLDLYVFQGATDGVWNYRLSTRNPDEDQLSSDDPLDLLIRDRDPADGRIDSYELVPL